MTITPTEVERIPLDEAAHLAWAAQAEFDQQSALQSFKQQLRAKLKVKDAEIEPDMFEDEYEPHRRIGATVDGLTFTLDKNRTLVAIVWRCGKKDCVAHNYMPVSDLRSLGKALALGSHMEVVQPYCQKHSS